MIFKVGSGGCGMNFQPGSDGGLFALAEIAGGGVDGALVAACSFASAGAFISAAVSWGWLAAWLADCDGWPTFGNCSFPCSGCASGGATACVCGADFVAYTEWSSVPAAVTLPC